MAFKRPFALDTNAFSLLLRGDAQVAELVTTAEAVAMPVVVVAELRAGFLHGGKSDIYGPVLDDFLADARVGVLQVTDETVQFYAELYAYVRAHGKQFSNNDLWIAALCLQYNYPLLSYDKDFDALPQLRRVKP